MRVERKIKTTKLRMLDNKKGYCIRMPIEPELGITAPCRLWCTFVALFTSCKRIEYQTEENLNENTRQVLKFTDNKNTIQEKIFQTIKMTNMNKSLQTSNSMKQTVCLSCLKIFICLKPGCLH